MTVGDFNNSHATGTTLVMTATSRAKAFYNCLTILRGQPRRYRSPSSIVRASLPIDVCIMFKNQTCTSLIFSISFAVAICISGTRLRTHFRTASVFTAHPVTVEDNRHVVVKLTSMLTIGVCVYLYRADATLSGYCSCRYRWVCWGAGRSRARRYLEPSLLCWPTHRCLLLEVSRYCTRLSVRRGTVGTPGPRVPPRS